MKSVAQTGFSRAIATIDKINPFALVRKNDVSEMLNVIKHLEESLRSSSMGQWTTAAEVNVSEDARWKQLQQLVLAGWAADTVVKRVVDKYSEWCLAGGIRFTLGDNAGYTSSTMKKLFPDGLFHIFNDYLFYFCIMGEMYFLPKFNKFRQLIGYELISPLEITSVHQDADTKKIFIVRKWEEENVKITGDGQDLEIERIWKQKAYTSDEVYIIKWNSSSYRGIPFLYPIIAWIQVYNEWLKDRSVTNRIRSFAFLKRKLLNPVGTAKVKADAFSSQMMRNNSYTPGRHDQYGFGYTREKMPVGGILTEDADTEWEPLQFKIQGDDAAPDGHAFRQQVCTLTGIPEALLFSDDQSTLDAADSRVEAFVRKIDFYRDMFVRDINGIISHVRNVELTNSNNIRVSGAGRRVDTNVNIHFKPAAVGERRFVTEDLNKAMAGGQISMETAREISPFVIDPELEDKRVRKEANDEVVQSHLDRIGTAPSNRDDEDTDDKKKTKDADAGTRSKKRVTDKKGAGEK